MPQPGEYEMTSRLPLTRSPTERSNVSHLETPTTEKVWIQVTERASESVENVEQTLKRGLEARQISMMALGGAIGTGLIIGSSTALVQGGPVGLLIGYVILGVNCWCVMMSLGEMSAYLPHKKGFAGYATRFWHPAGGFALGWNYLFNYWFLCPTQINSATLVLRWWTWTDAVPSAVWITLIICGITGVNLASVRFLGEVEFWFSSVKIIALIGLILFGILVDAGVNPKHQNIGFTYYRPPYGPFGSYLESIVSEGDTARFLGVCSVMTNALFAYLGTELVGVTVGEARNPRKTIPAAIKRTFWRILIFYIGNVFVIGLIVPRTEPLFTPNDSEINNLISVSPFVAAAKLFTIEGLEHVINSIALIFVLSAANTDLYISSRTLYGLALEGKAPRIFKRVNRFGVPYTALSASVALACFSFLSIGKGTGKVFQYLSNLCSTFGAIAWLCITYTHIRFMGAMKARGIDRKKHVPWVAPLQPGAAWFALVLTGIITVFKGFDTFMPFKADTFVTAYIAFPLFFLLFMGWRWFDGCGTIPLDKVDLVSGKRAIDEEEEEYLAEQKMKGPKSRWRRIWDAV